MSEANLWKKIRPALHGLDPVRIEVPSHSGVPDVNHAFGWIELKFEKRWPKRSTTALKVHHYTKQQRVWHTRRCLDGGICHVLIQVEDDLMLFDGVKAAVCIGLYNREGLLKRCERSWSMKEKLWRKELRDEILKKAIKLGRVSDQG